MSKKDETHLLSIVENNTNSRTREVTVQKLQIASFPRNSPSWKTKIINEIFLTV